MDLSCIISSGDLELYLLGMLPKDEANKIEQLALMFPEVQAELDTISAGLVDFAATADAAPSSQAKESLMGKLRELKKGEDLATPSPLRIVKSTSDSDDEKRITPLVPLNRRSGTYNFMMVAAVVLLVICLGLIPFMYSLNQRKKEEVAVLQRKVDTLSNSLSSQRQDLQVYASTLQMMQSPIFKKVPLSSMPGKPSAEAQVLWNTKTHEVYVAAMSMPQLPKGKQYQVWVIVDGKPVDAGMMQDNKTLTQQMKTFEKADAFAISVEKRGGNPTPTEVVMVGKTS